MSQTYYQLPNGRVASIDGDCDFPPVPLALTEPNGLIAIGGDLSFSRLLNAYQHGIFPWFSDDDPILWWSPNPRMVLFPSELKISNSLKKTLKNSSFEVRFNTAFRDVITACSNTPRANQNGTLTNNTLVNDSSVNSTWITEEIINAYCTLHDAGYAISAECWLDNKLVGGCYGVKIGNMFYGESMFHHVTDASKVAFVMLVQKLKAEGVALIDCQMKTPHLASFGAREINRDEFSKQLSIFVGVAL